MDSLSCGKDEIKLFSIMDKFNEFINQLNHDLSNFTMFINQFNNETININNEKYEQLLFENDEFKKVYDSKIREIVSFKNLCDLNFH